MTERTPLRWGVVGATSQVARSAVLPAMSASHRCEIVAVASRSRGVALDSEWVPRDARRYGDYGKLLDDEGVEALYVPLPNSMHLEWVCAALEAGLHVLCEKPLAGSAAEAAIMAATAERCERVLMEAYMSRFHPRWEAIQAKVDEGTLGQLRFARASFTFDGVAAKPDDYRWQAEMGGGALADVGIYCLAPIVAAVGRMPRGVAGSARWASGGVDASFSGWLDFGETWASLDCSFEAPERQSLELIGTEGSIYAERAFTAGTADRRFELRHRNGTDVVRSEGADPYQRMLEHFADVIQEGHRLSYPPSSSILVARIADALRSDAVARRDASSVEARPVGSGRSPLLP